ncbi:MAG: winged helix-turn-helix domain-containing protein [Povalibacter sp.]
MTSHMVTQPAEREQSDYQVGDLVIRTGTAQVLRGGEEIVLPRLSYDLLLALVRAAPNLVTLDELMERVWPGMVVSPETITQRIKLLRTAIDDAPRSPRYIASVRGRGYRMLAPVTACSADAPVPATPQEHTTPKAWKFIAFAIASLFVLAVAYWALRSRESTERAEVLLPARSIAVLPFENFGHSPQDAALAFGIPETLLHRLASYKELNVIARRSSFMFQAPASDIREIGRKLNARYIVEGSLQSDPERMRITAQLIDASDGRHVWSMQFDRRPQDIFVIEDEIAGQIAKALQLTVIGTGGRETSNLDAYLAFSQGRQRLATLRVAEVKLAIGDFERALSLDPKFATAYASLARAHVALALRDVNEERRANLEKAVATAHKLLERALQLDPNNADAHFELGALSEDALAAEAEIRRGLESAPSSVIGYERLQEVLWWQGRRNESIEALDRARELDPLDLNKDNIKARLVLYARSDVKQAEELSLKVLERDPSSSAALMRIGEIAWCCRSQYARGASYLEQSQRIDPNDESGRRMLMRAYLDMGDVAEANAVAATSNNAVDARLVSILLYEHNWRRAGESAYDEVHRETGRAIDGPALAFAVRMHARTTGDYESARRYLELKSGITWDENGMPKLEPYESGTGVTLAIVLLEMGRKEQATRLLNAELAAFDTESHQLGRGDMWYAIPTISALALLGRDDEALAALERMIDNGGGQGAWQWLESEPSYDKYRNVPRFQAVLDKIRKISARERQELQRLRDAQLIPWRTRPNKDASNR